MKFRDKIIDFQNSAEKEYDEKKSALTIIKFLLALILFFSSTILAGLTLPFRVLYKQFTKNEDSKLLVGNNENIDEQLKKNQLILIDFWAEWCGPCVMMNPIIDEFSKNSNNVKVIKINADFNMKTLKKFNVRGLPHFLLIDNGKEIKRYAGSMTLSDLNKFCSER